MLTRASRCPACGTDLIVETESKPRYPDDELNCQACGHGMFFRVEAAGDVNVVHLRGRGIVTEQNVMRVLERVRDLISAHGRDRLLLDFDGVNYLSSTILGRLINLAHHARDEHNHLKLCNLRPDIQDVFRITRLEGFFEMYPSQAAALASY
jgi:anti-anti-sigma factor